LVAVFDDDDRRVPINLGEDAVLLDARRDSVDRFASSQGDGLN